MIAEDIIKQNLGNTLNDTDFPELGEKYKGKVRDNYTKGSRRVIITTDRISAFDRVLTALPFKGQLLNQLSVFWFDKTKRIVANPIIDVPDLNIVVAKQCKIIPIEMVVRGYLAGSSWRDYQNGKDISGIRLAAGMRKNQKFESPIVTPSTKAEIGHDEHISKEDIIRKGILKKEVYEQMEDYAIRLFEAGTKWCIKQGLILADTKYEFGYMDGEIVVVDEMHTPDSSRFWYLNSYGELFEKNHEQRMLDKEYVRIWLINRGFMGDGEIPKIPDDVKIEAVKKYMAAYEQITGKEFEAYTTPILKRIEANLKRKGLL